MYCFINYLNEISHNIYNTNIDMSYEEDGQNYFCYLVIKSIPQCGVAIGLLAIALIIIFFGARSYLQIRYYNMSRHVTRIYMFVFCWGVFYVSKMLFAIIIYLTQKDASSNNDEHLAEMTKFYFIIDILTVYILQTAIITLPYNWMNNIISITAQLSNLENTDEDSAGANFEKKIVKLLKFYRLIRLAILLPIIPIIIITQGQYIRILSAIMIGMLYLEIGFVLVILQLGIVSLKKNTRIAELVEQQQFQLMIKRYLILIICTALRFILDTVFIYFSKDTFFNAQGKCKIDMTGKSEALNIILLLLEGILTHFLPILILYRIYSITQDDIKPSDSLLAIEPYKSDEESVKNSQ